ncbi:MAG: protein O-GlcNAcase [Micromonospora sp.]
MAAVPPPGRPADQGRALPVRGTVEGFYGPPWSHPERLAHLRFSAQVGLNTYVYAPKNDPYHRARWQDPYPAREFTQLTELAGTAAALGVRFVYAISPGLTMRYADDADYRALIAKATTLWEVGVRSFALFFDDVPAELTRPDELDRWPGAGAAGAAHGHTCARFAGFLAAQGVREPLLVCPTDYAGTDATPYREQFARTAPSDVIVAWTGRDIVVDQVSRDDVDRAVASYRRRVVLWDNFPVNDYDPGRLFLGPLTGRTTDVDGSGLVGVLANPMLQAVPSRIPLVTVADWARDPDGYDPATSARRALATVAGGGAADLAPLVRSCSAWPPSAEQDPELGRAVDGTLAGEPGALDVLTVRLDELARGCQAVAEPENLVSALRPWLLAGMATAEAGLTAARLLRATTAGDTGGPADGGVPALRDGTRRALASAESHYADVLRSVVPPFVRTVLRRTAPPPTGPADRRPPVLLVTGPRPAVGDEAIAELLGQRGYRVRLFDPATDVGTPAAVIVTRGASDAAIDAVVHAGVPLLAWHGLVPLGLARSSLVLMAQDRVHIVAADDPLAAGLRGTAQVYRGPAKLTVAEVGPHARVVARAGDDGAAALFHYPPGAGLADGTTAPAVRIGLYLGPDGPAPWLTTAEGRAIVAAAMDRLVGRIPGQPTAPEREHAGSEAQHLPGLPKLPL